MALTDRKKSVEQENLDSMNNSSPEKETLEHGAVESENQDSHVDGIIDLTATRKKLFHVNRGSGNPGILELNTSDMTVITRLEQLYPKLQKLSQEAAIKELDKQETDDEKTLTKLSQALTKIDIEMRNILDEIFDANVSEVCAPQGSMMDPFNGEFRFDHILDAISKLYENNINEEYKRMAARMKKRTSKYTVQHKGK